ncbi:serine protease Do [Chromohalobacter marismortui]|uniref:Probable periplasmic serine endoprotease DegP-like n=1 Tax=Chromohalobacter marismortui TaxID=42055 RepID=A0A4R7NWC2_9GAMM|nr:MULTISPECIES: DegQ family serine endoprotease [Chromohalobacter]MCI0510346.1 DegQ family serine endoprotease [Chromohalobacter sp.]MCI0593766.1 DegQ family serine endoprotease [Chromohalobacter sp.]TDU25079.1 serine protease Do [Chromohalobacter marismortui]
MERLSRYFSPFLLALVTLCAAQFAQARELPDFTQLVKDAAPGVVNISTTSTVERRGMQGFPFGGQDVPEIFRRFFGDQMPPMMPGVPGQGMEEERHSLGSGFVISRDGYIMTNAHVVDGADEIVVRFNDRRELKATLVGADKKTDVAVLKVDANNLPVLEMGDSDELQVGEWVAAIGSPFGFDHSVTAGIVSAIDRTLPSDAYVPFIQTDVAINPGNSGGPLFNLDGEVVGINSQIYTRSGGFMGVSFAIPINVAMDIADQLKDSGHVSRGWLGVVIQPVSQDLAESFGLDEARGALISQVTDDSPASEAGLKAGDVVLAVDGQTVQDSSTLPRLVGRVSPGDDVTLKILRDGEPRKIDVTVGHWPKEGEMVSGSPHQEDGSQARLGVAVSDLDERMRSQLGVDDGVVVRQVDPRGAAAAAGISPGDVIVSFNGQTIDSTDTLMQAVDAAPTDRAIPVRIVRDGQALFVALRLQSDDE